MKPIIWPDLAHDPEPTSEPRHIDLDAAWSDYVAVYDAEVPQDRELVLEATQRALDGIDHAWRTGELGELPSLAAQLGIDTPRDATNRHYPSDADPVPPDVLARLGADLDPALGNHAPDRLLGPWATLLELPRDERLLRVIMAAGALMVTEEHPFTPRRMWARRRPLPSQALREQVRAIAHAPFTVYPVLEVGSGQATLGAGVGSPTPEQPVPITGVASLPGEPPLTPGSTLAARIVATADGPVPCLAIAIPGPVPEAADAWLDLLLLEARLFDRRAGPRDVLRTGGHVLVRRVVEAAWLR